MSQGSNAIQIAQIITTLIAVAALVFNIIINRRSSKVIKSQFWLGLKDRFSESKRFEAKKQIRDNLMITLWPEIDDYLGLFEVCEMMLENNTIRLNDFNKLYKHEVRNLFFHDQIVFYKLTVEVAYWELIYNLSKRVFKHAQKEIATLYSLSLEIVKNHYSKIREKTSIASVPEIIGEQDFNKWKEVIRNIRNKID